MNVGDILKVRFKDKQAEGLQHIHTLYIEPSKDALKDYFKSVSGKIEIGIGKNYGLIDDVYVPPAIIKSHTLSNGVEVRGEAMKTYNIEKEQWGWKLFRIEKP